MDEKELEIEQINPLSLSDEEIEKMTLPEIEYATEDINEDIGNSQNTEEESINVNEDAHKDVEETITENTDDSEGIAEKVPDGIFSKDDTTISEEGTVSNETEEKVPENNTPKNNTEDTQEKSNKVIDNGIDYEAEYNKVFAPFRANGRDVRVQNSEQAIKLMQKGAGYNQRMVELKPHLKIIKMLENNGLSDPSKVSYLIDLANKKPEAITQLIKDSEIDPLDIEVDKESTYIPTDHTVPDSQVELDEVLADVARTDSYSTTMDVIGNKWDNASKKEMYQEPSIVKVINDHIGNGLYEEIDTQVQQQKMLGNLDGYSDLQAYTEIAKWMAQNKLFKSQQNTTLNTGLNVAATPITNDVKNTTEVRNKKAAGTTKKIVKTNTTKKIPNYLAMSDEEIAKL